MGNEKQNNQKEGINSKDFLIGTLIGGIVGASVALLYAPKAGKDLRQDLNTGAGQVRERASEWKNTAYDKGNELYQRAQESGKNLGEKIKQKKDDIQDRVEYLRSENKKEGEAIAEDVAEAIEEAADEMERQEADMNYQNSQK